MSSSIVSSKREGRVQWLTLDNPATGNALDRGAMVALTEALVECDGDEQTRVVVITGAGKTFCTGADLRAERAPSPNRSGSEQSKGADKPEPVFNTAIRTLWNLRKPVIAAVGGMAAGFGCSIALACDIRVASDRAKFSLVFVKRGLALDGGASFFLPRLAGLNGLEMALTGDTLDAPEAFRLGLVNRVVPAADFTSQIAAMAEKLAGNPPLAMAATKQLVHRGLSTDLDAVLAHEAEIVRSLIRSEDVREGIAAFLEKRPPIFRGR